jgi:hypothetical protein|tara:strand:+ start:2825 stop:4450 length:1626 start_codon:yes stop_codon:yes gene_type:complete
MQNKKPKIQTRIGGRDVTNPIFLLALIIILSVTIRLYYFPTDIPISLDGIDYFSYAITISQSGDFPSTIMPNNAWPSFVSLFFSLYNSENFLDYMNLQKMITVIFSVMTTILVYFLCTRFFDKYYALLGSILFAFEPRLIFNSLGGLIDPVYIFTITLALFLHLSKNSKYAILSFAIIGLTTIFRYEGFLLIIPFSIIFLVKFRKESNFLLKYFVGVSVFLIIVLSWSYLQYESAGTFSTLDSIYSGPFFISHYVIQESTTGPGGLLKDPDNPDTNLMSFISNSVELFVRYLVTINIPYFFFFVPFGVVIVARNYFLKKNNIQRNTIILFILALIIPAVYAYGREYQELRYFFVLFPIFSILSIPLIIKINQKIKNKKLLYVIFLACIMLSSTIFLEYEKIDHEIELESFSIATHLVNYDAKGVNTYQGNKYVKVAEIQKIWPDVPSFERWGHVNLNMKKVSVSDFESLTDFIKISRNESLSHLVIYEDNRDSKFLNDVFNNENRYPYLIKEFDSLESNYKKRVKIFEIDYVMFDSMMKEG